MGSLTLRLEPRLEQDLRAAALAAGPSRSAYVRDALRRHLALRRLLALNAELLPYAEAAGILGDEDIFDRIS